MTEHELSTLVRDHVSSDEPSFTGPEHVIARGRRTVRTRRITAGVGVAAVLAVAGAIVVPRLGGPADNGSGGIDAAVQEALDNYDAAEMPRILDDASRAVFSRSVPDLGEAEFFAGDSQYQSLAPEQYDNASLMSVSYGGDGERQLDVTLSHSASEAEGDAQEYCDSGLASGYYLECAADSDADGNIVISKLWALRGVDGKHGAFVVDKSKLDTIDPDKLWFEHSVKVVKSETFVTFVTETVKAPNQASAAELFVVPVTDLVELGTDPRLVIPPPPASPTNE
jgi:hypothetical protein